MAQKINPFSGRQFLDANGDPYSGAQLFIYSAGSSTKITTTKDSAGSSNHANPIILNSRGEPGDGAGASQAIWQSEGVSVKLVLAPSTDTDPPVAAISSWDNISGINDTTVTIDQWIAGPNPTYVDATSFTLVGDQTSDFHVNRRLKTSNTSGSIYSTIISSAYTTLTTITVINDSGTLDSGLSAASYGINTATNQSISSYAVTSLLETFTPTVQDSSLSDAEGQTYTTQKGFYTRIANRIFFDITLDVSSLGTLAAASSVRVANLPLASTSTTDYNSSISVGFGDNFSFTAGSSVTGTIAAGNSYITLFDWDSTSGVSPFILSQLGGTGILRISGNYAV